MIETQEKQLILNELIYSTFFNGGTIYNLKNSKRLNANLEVIYNLYTILNKGPIVEGEIVKVLQESHRMSELDSIDFVKQMIKYEILIENESVDYNNKKLWKEMDWEPSLLHYVDSRDMLFADIGNNGDYERKQEDYTNYLKISEPPEIYKKYLSNNYISLPNVLKKTHMSITDVLLNRKTSRNFKDIKLSMENLSYILFYGTYSARNIRKQLKENLEKDPALYSNSVFTSNEIYIAILNVDGIEKGIYHYDMESHGLHELSLNKDLSNIDYYCYGQPEMKNAAAVFFISANYEKYMWRYRHERAYRNLLIDVSQLAQSLILATTSNNQKTFLTPALRDTELVNLFELDPLKEDIRYLVAVGN